MVDWNDHYPFNSSWFAVWTRSRQEKTSAAILDKLCIPCYLPYTKEMRQWSDRKQRVDVPLFTGYLFVRLDCSLSQRLQVLKTPGIAGFVGNLHGPLPIPDHQIENIHRVLSTKVEGTILPLLVEGEWVRVVRGMLTGIEGRLIRTNSATRLAISVDLIHKSMVIDVSRDDVEPRNRFAA